MFFFSLRKYGTSEDHGLQLAIGTTGLLLSRLVLWAAIGCSAYQLIRPTRPDLRAAAGLFLVLVAASSRPCLVGFACTRHASILLYPASLFLLPPAVRHAC